MLAIAVFFRVATTHEQWTSNIFCSLSSGNCSETESPTDVTSECKLASQGGIHMKLLSL